MFDVFTPDRASGVLPLDSGTRNVESQISFLMVPSIDSVKQFVTTNPIGKMGTANLHAFEQPNICLTIASCHMPSLMLAADFV